MRFDILTIFPGFFESPLKQSILGKAVENRLVEVHIHDIRDFALINTGPRMTIHMAAERGWS